MNGPKFRFTIVMGFVLTLWWVFSVVRAYFLGEHGLNLPIYITQASHLLFLAGGGYGLVWLLLRAAHWNKIGLTGFEPNVVDEYGTEFRMGRSPFPLRLSRLLPMHVDAIPNTQMSQLEYEIFGFLSSMRSIPSQMGQGSVYDTALQRWHIVIRQDSATVYHRVFSLALELGLFYSFLHTRQSAAWHRFWERDKLASSYRAEFHSGLSAFVLSVLPSFRLSSQNLDSEEKTKRRALLTALQSLDEPALLPTNVHPLAQELLELLALFQTDASMQDETTLENCIATWIAYIETSPQHPSTLLKSYILSSVDGLGGWKLSDETILLPCAGFGDFIIREQLHLPLFRVSLQHRAFLFAGLLHTQNKEVMFNDVLVLPRTPLSWRVDGEVKLCVALGGVEKSIAAELPFLPDDAEPLLEDSDATEILMRGGGDMAARLEEVF